MQFLIYNLLILLRYAKIITSSHSMLGSLQFELRVAVIAHVRNKGWGGGLVTSVVCLYVK